MASYLSFILNQMKDVKPRLCFKFPRSLEKVNEISKMNQKTLV